MDTFLRGHTSFECLKTNLSPFQICPLCKGPRHVGRDPCGTSYRPLCIYQHPKVRLSILSRKVPEHSKVNVRLWKWMALKWQVSGKLRKVPDEKGLVTSRWWSLRMESPCTIFPWPYTLVSYLEGRFGVANMKVTFATSHQSSLIAWLYFQSICEQCKRLFIFTVQK